MQQQIRPIPAGEAAVTVWGTAGLVGLGTFAGLFILGDWTFLQGAFAGVVVAGALGILLQVTVGRVVPADALDHRPPTRRVSDPDPTLVVDFSAMSPRDLNAPSPHKDGVDRSMISDTEAGKGLNGPSFKQPIRGTVEAAPATRVPSPAPINATDPAVARPLGAAHTPPSMLTPTPLHGRIISPEPPQPMEGSAPRERMTLNEAAVAAGAPVSVRSTATYAAQSYNEPGDGSDTVIASGGTTADNAGGTPRNIAGTPDAASDDGSAGTSGSAQGGEDQSDAPTSENPAPIPGPAPGEAGTPAVEGEKPMTLDAPRDGSADDLKKIRGVGPKMEEMLNSMGFWHFDQIASWTDKEVAWVDQNLEGFKGRVSRDQWVAQARELSSGSA